MKRFGYFLLELLIVSILAAAILGVIWTAREPMDPRADKYSEGQCP